MQDVAKWQGWDKLIQDIAQKNDDLKALDQHWRDHMQQEEWDAMTKQHGESLEKLDALRKEMDRFYKLVSKAKQQEERSELLSWLQTVTPWAHYDAAVAKRRKYATGKWFLESDQFTDWKKKPNSFLWLIGEGTSAIKHRSNSRFFD